jgi:hypothetical protein
LHHAQKPVQLTVFAGLLALSWVSWRFCDSVRRISSTFVLAEPRLQTKSNTEEEQRLQVSKMFLEKRI